MEEQEYLKQTDRMKENSNIWSKFSTDGASTTNLGEIVNYVLKMFTLFLVWIWITSTKDSYFNFFFFYFINALFFLGQYVQESSAILTKIPRWEKPDRSRVGYP